MDNQDKLMTPAEVAAAFGVDPKTITRWAKAGKLRAVRTLGGHRRYREADIAVLLGGGTVVEEVHDPARVRRLGQPWWEE